MTKRLIGPIDNIVNKIIEPTQSGKKHTMQSNKSINKSIKKAKNHISIYIFYMKISIFHD